MTSPTIDVYTNIAHTLVQIAPYKTPIVKGTGAVTHLGQAIGDFIRSKVFTGKRDIETPCLPRGTYYIAHGTAKTFTGIFESAKFMHDYKFINLGKLYRSIVIAGGSSFIFANLLQLDREISIFRRITRLFPKLSEMPRDVKIHLFMTLGAIAMTIGYIISTVLALIGTAGAAAFTLMAISAILESVKNIYDFFHPYAYG